MRAGRLLAAGLIVGLVAGSVATADAARKKKKKKKVIKFVAADTTYYLVRPEEGACADVHLAFEPGTPGSACGNGLIWGVPGDVLIAAGLGDEDVQGFNAQPRAYPAAEGLPLILDASRDVEGQIVVKSYIGTTGGDNVFGGGLARLEIGLLGETGGEETAIGATEVEYVAQPASASPVVEFTLDVPDELDKAEFSSLQLVLRNRGTTVAHGFYSNDGDTFFTLPTFERKVVRR